MRKVNAMDVSSTAILQQSLGQLLRSVEGLFFVSSGASSLSLDNLDQFRILIGSQAVRFRCSSDGETLAVDDNVLCPSDLGEYGELRRGDLSKELMFDSIINRLLRRTLLLKSHEGIYTIVYVLEFDTGSLVICNWGDELKVWDKVPEQ